MTQPPPPDGAGAVARATRRVRGALAQRGGLDAEALAAEALARDGWRILARRLRTPSGEIDLVAEKDGLVAFIEVKRRPSLQAAAFALAPRQQARLLAAAEIALAAHPDWGSQGCRFDVILVDATGRVRRIADAFRALEAGP